MGFDLLDVYHSQGKSMDGMEVKNRHKLGGLELDKTRLLSLFLTGKRLRVSEFAKAKIISERHEAKNRLTHRVI